jgi:predicted transcriptional regulator
MSSKLITIDSATRAEWIASIERENAAELRAYKERHGLTYQGLAKEFGCSYASIERYLDERRAVPGYIVAAMRGKVAA